MGGATIPTVMAVRRAGRPLRPGGFLHRAKAAAPRAGTPRGHFCTVQKLLSPTKSYVRGENKSRRGPIRVTPVGAPHDSTWGRPCAGRSGGPGPALRPSGSARRLVIGRTKG